MKKTESSSGILSQSVQDYLKTIYKLQADGLVPTTGIAKELYVSGASVTGMLKRLAQMGLVAYSSYKGVKLTDIGEKVALEIIRHHRLLELYLKEKLGFSLDKVHDEACRLEHHISEEFAEKIDDMLGNPAFDPHGHPIPGKYGEMPDSDEKPLTSYESGKKVVVKRLADSDSQLLAYLEQKGLVPNVQVRIMDKAPFNGPITIKYNGSNHIIGSEIARSVFAVADINEVKHAKKAVS